MKKSILFWALLAIVFAGSVTGAYFLGKGKAQKIDDSIISELETLRAGKSEAAIVKRVSQQMEDIAYQQKAVSDQERERAQKQTELAIAMRDRAEQESRLAKEAEEKAYEAALEAEEQRTEARNHQIEAEMKRDEATLSQMRSDTLSYRTLGRNLGNSSITQYESGNHTLACQLAYASWYFLKNYGGNEYQPETFEALRICTKTTGSITTKNNGAITGYSPLEGVGAVAVTDYGEIELHRKVGARRTVLLQKKEYNFRDSWLDDRNDSTVVYAVSLHGPLCKVGMKSELQTIQLPYDTYFKIVEADSTHIIIAGKKNLLFFSVEDESFEKCMTLPTTLSSIVFAAGRVHVYFEDGTSAKIDKDFNLIDRTEKQGYVVTCAHYDESLGALFLGCQEGTIYIITKEGKQIFSLFGHLAKVTDLETVGCILVSLSFDKTANIWNLPLLKSEENETFAAMLGLDNQALGFSGSVSDNEWLTPASIKYDAWPLTICKFSDSEVTVGTSAGQSTRFNVSITEMAEKIKTMVDVNMSRTDWEHFVGFSVPYITF